MPTHYQGTPEEVLAMDTFIKLTRGTESLLARLAQRDTWGELTVRQFGALEALYHLGSLRQGELSEKLLKSGGNITLVVDNLEKRGLVRRERAAEDRRVVVATLTEAGQALIESLLPGHVRDVVEELSVLTSEEQATLGRLCRILGTRERHE